MDTLTSGYQKKKKTEQTSQPPKRIRQVPQQKQSSSTVAAPSFPQKQNKVTAEKYEQTSAPPEVLWGIDETCQFLGIGRTYVFLLIREHRLPVYRIGGRNRFDPREVWQWLQEWRRRQSL